MYGPVSVAVVLLIRKRIGGLSRMLALDGFIGACAIAALSAALVLEPVLDTAEGTATAMAVTIAYPVAGHRPRRAPRRGGRARWMGRSRAAGRCSPPA